MKAQDFLTIRDFDRDELCSILNLASDVKLHPERYVNALRGKGLAMIFEKPSLRTRVSFDVGIHQLGGFSVCLLPQEISLGKRESVHDVAKNLERMVNGIMIRTFSHSIAEEMARASSVPVINGLTDLFHPCQAMADIFTMRETRGKLMGLKLCFIGDGNNVAHSLLLAGAKLGINVTIVCPVGYEPNASVLRAAKEEGKRSKARIEVSSDPLEGVLGADVIYTDVWASMGQESQAAVRRSVFQPYQVNSSLINHAKKGAVFMHCLPAHRGEEVTDDVIDSPASVVFQQAENRLHVQKAIMVELMR